MKDIIGIVTLGIGLLLLFLLSFMGGVYIFNGNMIYSFIVALIIIAVLTLLVVALTSQKSRDRNKGYTVSEGLLTLVYIAAAVGSFFLMAHFVSLEFLLKDDIVQLGREKVEAMEKMLVDYEQTVEKTAENIDRDIDNAINAYDTHGNIGRLNAELEPYSIQIDDGNVNAAAAARSDNRSKLDAQKSRAYKGFDDITALTEEVARNSRANLEGWKRSKLHQTFIDIDTRTEMNAARLDTMFRAPASAGADYWNKYEFTTELPEESGEVLISSPFSLLEKYDPGLALPVIVAILLHLGILLPYFLTQRNGQRVFYSRKRPTGGFEL